MNLEKDFKKFKRAFWGIKPPITVARGGTTHKLKSLKGQNAKFLEDCTIRIKGLPVEFCQARELGGEERIVSAYFINDGKPHYSGCYARCSPDSVSALSGLYDAYREVEIRNLAINLKQKTR